MYSETFTGTMIEDLIAAVARVERSARYQAPPQVTLPELPLGYLARMASSPLEELAVV